MKNKKKSVKDKSSKQPGKEERKLSTREKARLFLINNIRLILGIIILVLGVIFMFIPFIPLGYLFIAMSLFFLATFFPPLKKFIEKLRKKDEHGIIDRAEKETKKLEDRINDKLNQ